MKKQATCYMCEEIATSREHVPPRCFFPKSFRNNLITVPSCDTHNTQKSKNDEYFLFRIVIHYENNVVAQNIFSETVMSALNRRPTLYNLFLAGENYNITINGEPSWALSFDSDRVEETVDCIARAIHFHHYGIKWKEELWIIPASAAFSPKHDKHKEQNARLEILRRTEFETPRLGNNQNIFYYQFLEDRVFTRLRMVFYEGFVIYAVPKKLMTLNQRHGKNSIRDTDK